MLESVRFEVYAQDIEATENKNHMLTAKNVTASSKETNDLGADKLNDGNWVNKTVGQVQHIHMKISG